MENIEGEFNPYYYFTKIQKDKVKTMASNAKWQLQLNFFESYQKED